MPPQIVQASKPSSAASGSTQQLDDTAGSSTGAVNNSGPTNANNNQSQQQQQQSSHHQIDTNNPTYIINEALSPKDQEDFFQAFWHYFMNTSSPIPQTITVKELGYIFRAFGQRVPEKELRQLMEMYGAKVGHHLLLLQQQALYSSGCFDQQQQPQTNVTIQNNNHHRTLKKETSFVSFGMEQQQPSLGETHQYNQSSSTSARFGAPPPHSSNNNNGVGAGGSNLPPHPPAQSRQGSRPSTVSLANNNNIVVGSSSSSSAPSTANQYVLNWNQFLLLMAQKLKSNDSEGALGDAFDVFDVKKQGYVLSKELRQFMTLLGDSRLSEEEVEKMIQEADVDGDGTIDKDEFIKMLQCRGSDCVAKEHLREAPKSGRRKH